MIPVSQPVLSTHTRTYILDCLKTGWVSSGGSYINRFENNFAQYLGVKYGVTTTNGTTALHLALAALNIGKHDEVILPDLTIISCAFAILYTGATPVIVDVDPKLGNIDPAKIETKITKRTKAIMIVHLYGHPADMDPIMAIAKKYHVAVIEDAAEAHGAIYKGKRVGSIGDIGCFSFYANKIITTGEGGMIVTNNPKLATHARLLKDLAHTPKQRFLHEEIGYNYRMTNLQAALGVAELEQIEVYIEKKRAMAKTYNELLKDIPHLELPSEMPWAKSVYWMYALHVKKSSPLTKNELRRKLALLGVETRDFFVPLHEQPVLRNIKGLLSNEKYSVSTDLSERGLYIPSGLALTKKQMVAVAHALHTALRS